MVCDIVIMSRVLLQTHCGQWVLTYDFKIAVVGQQLYWGQISNIYTTMHRIHHDTYDLIVLSRRVSESQVDVDLHSHIAARALQDEHLVDHTATNMCLHGVMGSYSHLEEADTVSIARKFAHIPCAELMIHIDSSTSVVLTIALLHYGSEYLHGWNYDTRSGTKDTPARFTYSIMILHNNMRIQLMRGLGIPGDFVGCEYFAFIRHGDAMGDIMSFSRTEIAEIMLIIADDETRMIIMSAAAADCSC